MNIFFIHGLLSLPTTATGQKFDAVTGITSIKLTYNPSATWATNWQSIVQQTAGKAKPGDLFVGESMGGFFAAQLAAYYGGIFYGWNPVVYPATQLMQFTDQDLTREDGATVRITKAAVQSYAGAPDARLTLRRVLLAMSLTDDLLDNTLAPLYYEEKQPLIDNVNDGHQFQQAATFRIVGARALALTEETAYKYVKYCVDNNIRPQ